MVYMYIYICVCIYIYSSHKMKCLSLIYILMQICPKRPSPEILYFYNWTKLSLGRASQMVLVVKNSPANEGDIRGLDPWVGRIPWRRACNPLQYSCLENPVDRGAWQATDHRVAKSQTQLKQPSSHALVSIMAT